MKKTTLPSATIKEAVNQLTDLQQRLFYQEYISNKKSSVIGFILWAFSLHYLYYRKGMLLVLFLLTCGGLGIWWIIDAFRIRKEVKKWNHTLALDLLARV